jgi:hypothetical protein
VYIPVVVLQLGLLAHEHDEDELPLLMLYDHMYKAAACEGDGAI